MSTGREVGYTTVTVSGFFAGFRLGLFLCRVAPLSAGSCYLCFLVPSFRAACLSLFVSAFYLLPCRPNYPRRVEAAPSRCCRTTSRADSCAEVRWSPGTRRPCSTSTSTPSTSRWVLGGSPFLPSARPCVPFVASSSSFLMVLTSVCSAKGVRFRVVGGH